MLDEAGKPPWMSYPPVLSLRLQETVLRKTDPTALHVTGCTWSPKQEAFPGMACLSERPQTHPVGAHGPGAPSTVSPQLKVWFTAVSPGPRAGPGASCNKHPGPGASCNKHQQMLLKWTKDEGTNNVVHSHFSLWATKLGQSWIRYAKGTALTPVLRSKTTEEKNVMSHPQHPNTRNRWPKGPIHQRHSRWLSDD